MNKESKPAGRRIDEPSSSCGMTAAEIDQFGEDLRNKPFVDFPEFEQPDTITVKLDPTKCRIVDPALPYDEPNDFDAMSENHRSPGCKCHEFPIDAELVVPVKINPIQELINQLTKEIFEARHIANSDKQPPDNFDKNFYVQSPSDYFAGVDTGLCRAIELLKRLKVEQGE